MVTSSIEPNENKTSTITKDEIKDTNNMDTIKTLDSSEEIDDIKTLASVEKTKIYRAMNSIDLYGDKDQLKSIPAAESDGTLASSSVLNAHKYKTLTSWEATIIVLLFAANFFLFMCSLGYLGMGSSLLVLDKHLGDWEKYAGRKILNLGLILIVLGLLLCICTSIGYGMFRRRDQPAWVKFYTSVMVILLLLLLLGIIVYLVPANDVEEKAPGLWDKVKSKIPQKGRNKWNELKEGIKNKLKPQKYEDGKEFIRMFKIVVTIWVAVPLVATLLIMMCSIVLSILLLRTQSAQDSPNTQVYLMYHKDSLMLKRN